MDMFLGVINDSKFGSVSFRFVLQFEFNKQAKLLYLL